MLSDLTMMEFGTYRVGITGEEVCIIIDHSPNEISQLAGVNDGATFLPQQARAKHHAEMKCVHVV